MRLSNPYELTQLSYIHTGNHAPRTDPSHTRQIRCVPIHSSPRTPAILTTPEMLDQVAALNGRVFDEDPVIAYMLLDMSRDERLDYLPTYWSKLGKSALMNDAVITEADGWKAGAIVIPPGGRVENVWTLVYAGFLGVLWRVGVSGMKVSLFSFFWFLVF